MLPNAVMTITGSCGVELLRRAQHAEAVALGQAQIGQDDGGIGWRGSAGLGLGLIARLDDGMPLRLERVAQHRAERVLVFDEQDGRDDRTGWPRTLMPTTAFGMIGASCRSGHRNQPGGTPARRASSSRSAIGLLVVDDALASGG